MLARRDISDGLNSIFCEIAERLGRETEGCGEFDKASLLDRYVDE